MDLEVDTQALRSIAGGLRSAQNAFEGAIGGASYAYSDVTLGSSEVAAAIDEFLSNARRAQGDFLDELRDTLERLALAVDAYEQQERQLSEQMDVSGERGRSL